MDTKVTNQENKVNTKSQELLTEKEVAQKYRLSTITLYRARKRGELPYLQVGTKVLYRAKGVQDWLARFEKNVEEALS